MIIIIKKEWYPMKTLKYSRQREELYELLSSVNTHPTADWLYGELRKSIPSISLGTVYRNLTLLIEAGKVQKITVGTSTDHFDANTSNHYHFVCNCCGQVYDLDMDVIENLEQEAQDQSGHEVTDHSLLFYGTCNACKEKQKENRKED